MLNTNIENGLNISAAENSILKISNNELVNQTKKQTNKWAKAGITLLLSTAFVSVSALFFIFNQKKNIPIEKVPTPLNNPNSLVNSNLQIEKGWHINPENPHLNFLMKYPVCLPNEMMNQSVSNSPQVLNAEKIIPLNIILKNPLPVINKAFGNHSLNNIPLNKPKQKELLDNKNIEKRAKREFFYIPGQSKDLNFAKDVWENPIAFVVWVGLFGVMTSIAKAKGLIN